jgi:hypothetical protein
VGLSSGRPDAGGQLDAGSDTGVRGDAGSDGTLPDSGQKGVEGGRDAARDVGLDVVDGGGCDANLTDDPTSCGSCGHDCAGGTCVAGVCQPLDLVSAPSGQTVRAIAIDSSHLYWGNTTDQTVVIANLDGTSPTSFLTGVQIEEIAVDATALYYTAGDGLHVVPFATMTDTHVASGPEGCVWPVSSGLAYSVEFGANNVVSVDLDSGTVTTLLSAADGIFQPWGIASTATELFWTSSGPDVDGSITSQPLPSGAAVTLRSGLSNPNCLSFDEKGRLYWPNHVDGTIHRCNVDGSGDVTLASGQVMPTTVAVSLHYLYWNSGNNVVRLAR